MQNEASSSDSGLPSSEGSPDDCRTCWDCVCVCVCVCVCECVCVCVCVCVHIQ